MTMPRSFFSLSFLLLWTSSAVGQTTFLDPPAIDRPPDFSNIVGKYDIRISAEPTDVQVEQSITLRVCISGAGPKGYEPNSKYLRLFPESWDNDFYVQEMPEQHEVVRDKKTWLFVYRLKPKNVKVAAIDDIKLVYYNPHISDKDKFVTKYADGIKIAVTPKPDQSDEMELAVRAAPDSFYHYIGSQAVLARSNGTFTLTGGQLILLVLIPPLICLVGVIARLRYFPDEAQRASRFREASAQRALRQLEAGGCSARLIVCRFLRERFACTIADPGPVEIAAFLRGRGFALALCAQSEVFFQACDAGRFTASAPFDARPTADAAVRLIQSLEADPCARG